VERSVDLLKSQFDIDREPFSDTGISGLFYPGAGRQQALEQLLHLVRYGPPLLLVVGDEGSGKTLLSHQLKRQLDNSIFSCVSIEATVLMDDRALMALICDGFNLHVELTKDNVVSALVRFSAESESYSQTALVVIDGVQNLSETAAEFLAEIVASVKDGGLRFLLLVDTVDIKQEGALSSLMELMDSLGQSLQLSALDVSEVTDYLSFRMRTAGLDGVRFSPQQVKQITGESEGIIARINQFARETLVHQVPVIAKEQRRQILSPWHLVLVAVISVGIGLLLVGEQGQDSVVEVQGNEVLSHQQHKSEQSAPSFESEDVDVDAAPGKQSELIDLNYAKNETSVENNFATEVGLKKPDVVKIEVQDSAAKKSAAKISAVKKMEWDSSIKAKPNDVGSDALVLAKEITPTDALSEEIKPVAIKPVAIKPVVIKPVVTKLVVTKPAVINKNASTPVTNKSSKSESRESTKKGSKQNKKPRLNDYTLREKWLLSLDPKQYTLQMIGARDEAAVQEFISIYPSLTKVAYYKTLFKGSDWYVVIYGQFATKNEARQAVTRLPKKLIASKPWARPLASVQKDIRMARL